MSKAKLAAAKELIQERKFKEARVVLESAPDDKTAKAWLIQLEKISPHAPVLQEMSNEWLIKHLEDHAVLDEIIKRLGKLRYACFFGFSEEEKNSARKEFNEITHLAIQHTVAGAPRDYNIVDKRELLLPFILQLASEMPRSSWWDYEPALEELGKLMYHENSSIKDYASVILSKYDSITARILLNNRYSASGYRIVRPNLDNIDLSKIQTPIRLVDVIKKDKWIFSIFIERAVSQNDFHFVIHFPPDNWTEIHYEIAPIVLDITNDARVYLSYLEISDPNEDYFDIGDEDEDDDYDWDNDNEDYDDEDE